MQSGLFRISAAVVALGLLGAPVAHADWHGHDHGDQHDRGDHWDGHDHGGGDHWEGHDHGGGGGDAVAGALIGLGLGAVLGGVIASQPAYAAPPVVAGPPPQYAPPPGYGYAQPSYGYPAPQGYYAAPYGQ